MTPLQIKLLSILALASCTAPACAQVNFDIWNGGSGSWSGASNWSCFTSSSPLPQPCVPQAAEVSLGSDPAALVRVDLPVGVASLTASGNQTVFVEPGATLVVGGTFDVGILGAAAQAAIAGQTISADGLVLNGASVTTITPFGLSVSGSLQIAGNSVITGGITLEATAAFPSSIANSTILGGGTLQVDPGASLTVTDPIFLGTTSGGGPPNLFHITTLGSMTVAGSPGGLGFNNVGTWDVNGGGTLTLSGGLINLNPTGGAVFGINNEGMLPVGATTATVNVENGGAIVGAKGSDAQLLIGSLQNATQAGGILSGTVESGTLTISAGGIVNVPAVQILFGTATVTGSGSLLQTPSLAVGGEAVSGQPFTSGHLQVAGGAQALAGIVAVSYGSLTVSGSGSLLAGAGIDVGSYAILEADGGGVVLGTAAVIAAAPGTPANGSATATLTGAGTKLDVAGPVTIGTAGGAGTLSVQNGAQVQADSLVVGANGTLSGTLGAITARSITILPGGTVSPGDPGPMALNGNVTFSPGSLLTLAVAGPGNYDALHISGSANFAGVVDLDFINGFAPTAGEAFAFVTASGGAFNWNPSSINFIGVTPGSYSIDSSDGFELIVTGDWNADAGGGGTAVPEPATAALCLMAVALLSLRRACPTVRRRVWRARRAPLRLPSPP